MGWRGILMSMDLFEAIERRRSVRQYSAKPVERAVVEKIVAAGLRAPSACNIQPWEFVVITDSEQRKRITEVAEYGQFIATAPVCIAVFCKAGNWTIEDGSAATENMLLAATALGLGSCWVGGDNERNQKGIPKVLGVPEGYRLISLIAIGYPAADGNSPPRRPLDKVVHWEKW